MREYKFVTGVSSTALPTPATPSASYDLITLSFADARYGALTTTIQTGTRAAPTAIVAATGLPFTGTALFNIAFVKGPSAGTTAITAAARIQAGTTVGQKLKVVMMSATDFPSFDTGNGVDLNGKWTADSQGMELNLWWDGTNWKEEFRT